MMAGNELVRDERGSEQKIAFVQLRSVVVVMADRVRGCRMLVIAESDRSLEGRAEPLHVVLSFRHLREKLRNVRLNLVEIRRQALSDFFGRPGEETRIRFQKLMKLRLAPFES